MDASSALRAIETGISCPKWAKIFKQNLDEEKMQWRNNMKALHANSRKNVPDVATWSQSNGLWPGEALCLFAAHSRWIHLSTNTLPFYNVYPRLQGQFPGDINTMAGDWESPLNHWLHEGCEQT